MSYDIAFTQVFKDGVVRLPKATYPVIDRQIHWLATDPYAKNPNAKRLKNVRQTFRMRIGKDVRMLYRVDGRRQRVELFNIGERGDIYNGLESAGRVLTETEANAVRALLQGADAAQETVVAEVNQPAPPPSAEDIQVEQLAWISADELFLLNVPHALWPDILATGALEQLQQSSLPGHVKLLIEDYWTNPSETQVEKLYSLAPAQDLAAIAQQPLGHFLLALDPEQKEALRRLKADGPYLLKGSAGTGKSLVGLYHMRDLIVARAGTSLFDGTPAKFGVITYTNTLVGANVALLRNITPNSTHTEIDCTTLDLLAYHLAELYLGSKPNALSTEGLSKWLAEQVLPHMAPEVQSLAGRLGPDYLADEIEQAIVGNGLNSVDVYVKHDRKGRKRGLRDPERRTVWAVYMALQDLMQRKGVQSFEQWRGLALAYLRANPNYPRYAALFVDEAQDFSKVARQLCLELVRDPKHLVLAADTGQSIYTVPQPWGRSDSRFDFKRRQPIQLSRSYRATQQIGLAIAPLRADPGDDDDRSPNASPVFSGPKPKWIDAPLVKHTDVVVHELQQLLASSTPAINAGQVAIVVRDSQRAARYLTELAAHGIAATLIEKHSPLRLSGDQVHIVTAHSSKGLGFPIVYVVDVYANSYPAKFLLDKARDDQQREQILENEQRLLYVALSRASHRLTMVADSDPKQASPFLAKLNRSQFWS